MIPALIPIAHKNPKHPAAAAWQEVFGGLACPVEEVTPHLADSPIGVVYFYKADLRRLLPRLSAAQLQALARRVSADFEVTAEEVLRGLSDEHGLPLLADGVEVRMESAENWPLLQRPAADQVPMRLLLRIPVSEGLHGIAIDAPVNEEAVARALAEAVPEQRAELLALLQQLPSALDVLSGLAHLLRGHVLVEARADGGGPVLATAIGRLTCGQGTGQAKCRHIGGCTWPEGPCLRTASSGANP